MQSQIDNYLIFYIVIIRIIELFLSLKNSKKLLSSGGIEYHSAHYKYIVMFHFVFVLYFLKYSLTFEDINTNLLYFFFVCSVVQIQSHL